MSVTTRSSFYDQGRNMSNRTDASWIDSHRTLHPHCTAAVDIQGCIRCGTTSNVEKQLWCIPIKENGLASFMAV